MEDDDRPPREGEALLFAVRSAAGFKRASERKLAQYVEQALKSGYTMDSCAEAAGMSKKELADIIEESKRL